MPGLETDSAAFRVREWMDGRTTVLDPDDAREVYVAGERAARDLDNVRGELRAVHAEKHRYMTERDRARAELEAARQATRAEVAAELNALIYHCPVHDIPGSARLDPGCPGCQRYSALSGVAALVAGHNSPNADAVRERRLVGAPSLAGNDE